MSRRRNPGTVRVYARITPELYTLLGQVRAANRFASDADVVRAALRAYLEEQGDQVASRRHFSTSFKRRIDRLEWHLMVMTYLLSQALALLVAHATGQKLPGDALLDQAIRLAVANRESLAERLDAGRVEVEAAERRTR